MSDKNKFDKEIIEGLKGAIEEGFIEKIGKDSFRLTKKGKDYVERTFPRTQARANLGKMSISEYMASCEDERREKNR